MIDSICKFFDVNKGGYQTFSFGPNLPGLPLEAAQHIFNRLSIKENVNYFNSSKGRNKVVRAIRPEIGLLTDVINISKNNLFNSPCEFHTFHRSFYLVPRKNSDGYDYSSDDTDLILKNKLGFLNSVSLLYKAITSNNEDDTTSIEFSSLLKKLGIIQCNCSFLKDEDKGIIFESIGLKDSVTQELSKLVSDFIKSNQLVIKKTGPQAE